MTKKLPLVEFALKQARRKTCRRVASALIRGMAETDSGFEFIAMRLGKSEQEIEQWMFSMVRGNARDLNEVSDLALAMDLEIEFSLRQYQQITPAEATPTEERKSEAA